MLDVDAEDPELGVAVIVSWVPLGNFLTQGTTVPLPAKEHTSVPDPPP